MSRNPSVTRKCSPYITKFRLIVRHFSEAPVEYEPEFARSFMRRTLEILKSYSGPYDATLLVNCLLGLLVVPKESLIDKVPIDPFDQLSSWGIRPESIQRTGHCDYGHEQKSNLRQLVRRLRNALAHFNVDPIHDRGVVSAFRFEDRNGFRAVVPLSELHTLATRLAEHLEKNA